MEETVFSVTTILDEKTAFSLVCRQHKAVYLMIHTALAAFAAWYAVRCAKWQMWGFFCIFLLLAAAVVLRYFVFSRRALVKREFRTYRALCKTDPKKTVTFSSEELASNDENTGSVVHMRYEDISRLLETKDALALINRKANVSVILSKSGFTQGDAAGLITFLSQKNPKLKPKRFCIL